MSHNRIVKPPKAALMAVGVLLKLVVSIVSGCASVLFVAFRNSSAKNDPDNLGFKTLKRGIDADVGDGLY